ncbi:hypothetical protein L915_03288, partial [Phytophthora nicotianae]
HSTQTLRVKPTVSITNALNVDESDGVEDYSNEMYSIWRDSSEIIESTALHPAVFQCASLPDGKITPILAAFTRYRMIE